MATVADLKESRIKAKKSLGQNFVTDDNVLKDIVSAAGVQAGDLIVEIGPGTGNLTKHLLEKGAIVTAVEKDDTLYARLVEQYKEEPNLRLVHGDVLRTDVRAIIEGMLAQQRSDATPAPGEGGASTSGGGEATSASSGAQAGKSDVARKVKVLSNLPYNITTDFLVQMFPLGDIVSELSIMIQEEAARRLCERKPGGSDWRAMNLRTLFYSRPKYRFCISRFKYDPVPGVDGALVSFVLLPPGTRQRVPSEAIFFSLINKAFSERRKMMRNSLQPLYSSQQVEAALQASGLRVEARAQDLSLEQFVTFAWKLQSAVLADAGIEGDKATSSSKTEA